jgi:phosphinothricin acetyltransferase
MIREAEPRDASDLARIYNQAMKPGIYATCDVTPVSGDNRLAWLAHHHHPYPAWVYETERGDVIGWCSLSPFSVRATYPGIAETSTYVDEAARYRRIGSELLRHLVVQGRALGFRALVSLVFEKNIASVSTRLRYGFRPNAVLYEVARMEGVWENVVWLQKDLTASDPLPE